MNDFYITDYTGRSSRTITLQEEKAHCTLYCMTRNKNPLLSPYLFYLSIDQEVNEDKINQIINEEFNKNFVSKILEKRRLF